MIFIVFTIKKAYVCSVIKSLFMIHEFDPLIYPRKLWVAKSTDILSDRFEGLSDWDDNSYAMVNNVYDKVHGKGGILVRFAEGGLTVSTIAHESSHAAMDIFSYIGATVDLDNQEPYSYLVGWIASCLEQVRTGVKG